MPNPFSRALLTSVFFALGAAGASAAPVECTYDAWRGAESNKIAISWVGVGFIADPARATIQVQLPDGSYPAEEAEVVKQANFTGFVLYRTARASDGSINRVRYSFRIYTSGKCEGRMDQSGFVALVGSGKVK